jgi:hypothetical protein
MDPLVELESSTHMDWGQVFVLFVLFVRRG